MCSPLIVCVQIPRFELAVAAGGRETLASGPVALAPEAGREQLIGQASAAAEAYGVCAGLRLGEALARCPTLRLVPPDPAGVADEWERLGMVPSQRVLVGDLRQLLVGTDDHPPFVWLRLQPLSRWVG